MEQVFYMIHRTGGHAPVVRHDTLASVMKEAKRLAEKNPGAEFIVLKAICKMQGEVSVMATVW